MVPQKNFWGGYATGMIFLKLNLTILSMSPMKKFHRCENNLLIKKMYSVNKCAVMQILNTEWGANHSKCEESVKITKTGEHTHKELCFQFSVFWCSFSPSSKYLKSIVFGYVGCRKTFQWEPYCSVSTKRKDQFLHVIIYCMKKM